MKAVTAALIPTGEAFPFGFRSGDEDVKNAFSELERLLRMDRWLPSFQHVISQAALASKEQLAAKGIGTLTFGELLLYTREGVFDVLRAQAFEILLNLGALRHAPLVKLIFYTLRNDPSPFVRRRLIQAIERGFGSMALTGNVQLNTQTGGDEMVIEEDAAQSVAVRKDLLERANIAGAIQALRKELSEDKILKDELWECAKYNSFYVRSANFSSLTLDLSIRQHILDLCRILYDEKTSYLVVLQLPKKRKRFVCHNLGKVKLFFRCV
jgi:transcription initiation factor TFIID subunit 2